MQVQLLSRNVTSKTQRRCSCGSSNEIHSWASSRSRPLALPFAVACVRESVRRAIDPPDLSPQLAGGEQALPELVHHHSLVRRVNAVVRQADAEEKHGCAEHPPERLLRPASTFAREEGWLVPYPLERAAQRAHQRMVDGREAGRDTALVAQFELDAVGHPRAEPA